MLKRCISGVVWCAMAAFTTLALAQTYPVKPVRIMVGANAGGGTDIIARMLADKYQGALGQPFVVENQPGASNTIAADVTAKAPPDGHTLLVATNTGQAIAPHLIKLSFDTNKDLIPGRADRRRAERARGRPRMCRRTTCKDLIALIKAKPEASPTARRAWAARSISPARRSISRREPRPCTFRTRARRKRWPISSAGRSSSTSTRRRRRWRSSRAARSRRSR